MLIPGLRSSEGPGKLQGGEGKAALQTSSLASTPTPPQGGGRAAQGAWQRQQRQRKGCHHPFFLLVQASPEADDSPAVTPLTGTNEIRVTELMCSDWTPDRHPILQGRPQARSAPPTTCQLLYQMVLGHRLLSEGPMVPGGPGFPKTPAGLTQVDGYWHRCVD